MTAQERKLKREKELAAEYINAHSDVFMEACKAKTNSFSALSDLLNRIRAQVWSMTGEQRQAVQVQIQSPIATAVSRIERGYAINHAAIINRLFKI